jgi:hypothetical protein
MQSAVPRRLCSPESATLPPLNSYKSVASPRLSVLALNKALRFWAFVSACNGSLRAAPRRASFRRGISVRPLRPLRHRRQSASRRLEFARRAPWVSPDGGGSLTALTSITRTPIGPPQEKIPWLLQNMAAHSLQRRVGQHYGCPVPSGEIRRSRADHPKELPGSITQMLTKRIIACLDVKDGRVVKGIQFVDLIDAGDPAALAVAHAEAGADEIVLLDITATHEGRGTLIDTVKRASRGYSCPLPSAAVFEPSMTPRRSSTQEQTRSASTRRRSPVLSSSTKLGAVSEPRR